MNIKFVEKCKDRLNRISDSMLNTNQVFSVLMQMREFQQENNELINISPSFYGCVISCFIEVLFIDINKMFDPDTDSDGIFGLLNTIEKNIHNFDNNRNIEVNWTEELNFSKVTVRKYDNLEQLINDSIKLINEQYELLCRVKKQRDQFYAHQDKKINIDTFFSDYPVSIKDLEMLIILNVNIFNSLNVYFNNKTLYPVAVNCDDFKKTIYYIKKGVQELRDEEG